MDSKKINMEMTNDFAALLVIIYKHSPHMIMWRMIPIELVIVFV